MANRIKFTPEKKTKFCDALRANGGHVQNAAKLACITPRCVYDHRNKDEAFRAEWAAALDESTAVLEDEAIRRAVEGVSEPVFYQGVVCGEVQKYSDILLIFMLKARRPNVYRENIRHEHGGLDGLPIAVHAVSDEELKRIIAAEGATNE